MSSLFSPLSAVLFDLDGTLVETHIDFPAMTAAMQQLAQAWNVPASIIEGKDILGIVDAAAEDVQVRGGDSASLRRTAFAKLEAMEVEGCAHPILLPGTHELLTALVAQDIKVGIVTRNCRTVAVQLLAKFTLPHHLLLTRDDVTRTKPNPEHLWDALRLLSASADSAAMVGDHWMDIQAGERAGCAATLGVLGRNDADWFVSCPPSVLVRDLAEAAPLFGLD
ncbi:MAG: HAD family hydrolase [Janthinobacterium lividum]